MRRLLQWLLRSRALLLLHVARLAMWRWGNPTLLLCLRKSGKRRRLESLPFHTRIHRHHLVCLRRRCLQKRRLSPHPKWRRLRLQSRKLRPREREALNHHLSLPADLKDIPAGIPSPRERVSPTATPFVAMSSPAFATSPLLDGMTSSSRSVFRAFFVVTNTRTCSRTTR